ncbi:hypothetical protein AAZX31_03G033400 [Glycine max]
MLQLSEEPQCRRQDHHRPPTMPSCFPARQMWRQHSLHDHHQGLKRKSRTQETGNYLLAYQ